MTLKNLQKRQYLKLEVMSSFENLSSYSPDNALSFPKNFCENRFNNNKTLKRKHRKTRGKRKTLNPFRYAVSETNRAIQSLQM